MLQIDFIILLKWDGGENGSKLAAVCDKFGPPPEGANAFDLQFTDPQEALSGEPQT